MKIIILMTLGLLVALNFVLMLTPAIAPPLLQSQWQGNQYRIEKYFRFHANDRMDNLVVGSSLTDRLDFGDLTGCVYKLSLAGDGSLTALAVAVKANITPKNIWIEINVPERKVNEGLIQDSSGYLKSLPVFQVENHPINLLPDAYYRFKKTYTESKTHHNSEISQSDSVIETNVRQSSIAMQAKNYSVGVPIDVLKERMKEFLYLVNQLESKGAKVGFFEMPIFPELIGSPKAVQIRAAFIKAFPNNKFISSDELSKGLTITTIDGIHLHNGETRAVAMNLESFFPERCQSLR